MMARAAVTDRLAVGTEKPVMCPAPEQARVVTDNNKYEEGGHEGKIPLCQLPSHNSLEVGLELADAHLRQILQQSRHFFHISGCQPGDQRQERNNHPHGDQDPCYFNWADGKQDVR